MGKQTEGSEKVEAGKPIPSLLKDEHGLEHRSTVEMVSGSVLPGCR